MKKTNNVKIDSLNNLNEFYAEATSQLNVALIHWEKIDEIIKKYLLKSNSNNNSNNTNNSGNNVNSNNRVNNSLLNGNKDNITNITSNININVTNFNLQEKTIEFHNCLINIKSSVQQHYLKMNDCLKMIVSKFIYFL